MPCERPAALADSDTSAEPISPSNTSLRHLCITFPFALILQQGRNSCLGLVLPTRPWDGHLASVAASEPETPIWIFSSNRPPAPARTRAFFSLPHQTGVESRSACDNLGSSFRSQSLGSTLVELGATGIDWFAIHSESGPVDRRGTPTWLGGDLDVAAGMKSRVSRLLRLDDHPSRQGAVLVCLWCPTVFAHNETQRTR